MDTTELISRIEQGFIVERPEEMDDEYRAVLRETLIVSGDTEFVSAATLLTAVPKAPSVQSQMSLLSVIQDEIGHAHIAYRLLADLGEDITALVYEREPARFKHPYAFDFEVRDWSEMAVLNALFDRAGFVLLSDVHRNSSYGPWRRALAKVDKEQTFHIRHGETWVRRLAADEATRAEVQRAVDWMFPAALEFFGLPDDMKHRPAQLTYRIRATPNEKLRQDWLASAVPFLRDCGLDVPAHFDEPSQTWVLDFPFPCAFLPGERRWVFDQPVTWHDVLARWRGRGPRNGEFVSQLQRGHRALAELSGAAA